MTGKILNLIFILITEWVIRHTHNSLLCVCVTTHIVGSLSSPHSSQNRERESGKSGLETLEKLNDERDAQVILNVKSILLEWKLLYK